jgi:hypothetical protein
MSTASGMNALGPGRASSAANTEPRSGAVGGRDADVAEYLAAVREALRDLEPGVRDGLLEDLPDHLAEVAAADARPLGDNLGTARAFADELRSAAGLPPASASTTASADDTGMSSVDLAREYLTRLNRGFARLCGYGSPRELQLALQPVWWVVRGAGVATFLLQLSHAITLPYLTAKYAIGVLVVAAIGSIASVRLGRVWQRTASGRRAAVVVNALCVIPVFTTLVAILTRL